MDITPLVAEKTPLVQRYGDGGFVIAGESFSGSVLIGPNGAMSWSAVTPADITVESLRPLIEQAEGIELLLIGAGKTQIFLSPDFREGMRQHRIIIDCMDTGAACRTFNVLLAEGRRVGAALLAV